METVLLTLSTCTGCQLAIEGLNRLHSDSMVLFTFTTATTITITGIIKRPSVIYDRRIPIKLPSNKLQYGCAYDSLFYFGIVLMTLCLFLSSYMGIFQEDLFKTYGRHSDEVMWGMNAITLPMYIMYHESISNAFMDYCNSNSLAVLGIKLPITELWAVLLGILVLQYTCIKNVYKLNSKMNSLNLTMILTLRKFLNLLLSVLIFKNQFNYINFIGATMVFIGTYLFYSEKRAKTE
ncbi:unnamed protein product [Bursaphelenchus okinawaensis]|uniref:Uncharacterized protein n=1 Tax=Bursaphelenchus okinawaensis TaxID=465554 RepID=A0A811KPI9_9BILA|nr:unnamed protein product [Bursaphelenchus okinawaensis]CAG9110224.1 unnamed protein product [Bursaphelenchus okinawaensis]